MRRTDTIDRYQPWPVTSFASCDRLSVWRQVAGPSICSLAGRLLSLARYLLVDGDGTWLLSIAQASRRNPWTPVGQSPECCTSPYLSAVAGVPDAAGDAERHS